MEADKWNFLQYCKVIRHTRFLLFTCRGYNAQLERDLEWNQLFQLLSSTGLFQTSFSPSLQKKCSNWLHCFHPSLFGFPIATRCVTPQLLPQCATATRQSPWRTLIPHTRWDNCWQRRFWIFPKMDRILLAMVKNEWPQTWILYYHKKPNHGCCARKALTLELMLPWNLAGSTARNIKQVCYQT